MNSIWDTTFIVVDVETTGSDPVRNRLTDIACVIVQNGEIVSSFSSLINPHQFIPPFIQKMTGINNEMAFAAPEAEQVLTEALESFKHKNCVFVAHNAKFDWSFLEESLKRENLPLINIPVLCTLKLARRVLPKNLKKNVGSLAEYFGIKIKNRHRALGDAMATAEILTELCEKTESEHNIATIEELLTFQNKIIKSFRPVPAGAKRVEEQLAELPDSPGVYYFIDKNDKILYIGKAKSLRERVKSYFSMGEITSKKVIELVKKVYDLKWTNTTSELSALLLESKEIKKHKPQYNVLQKRYRRYPFIKIPADSRFPRPSITYMPEDDCAEYFGPFKNTSSAFQILDDLEKKFKLIKCSKIIVPNKANRPCLYHQIDMCMAPCAVLCSEKEYAEEIERVRFYLSGFTDGIISKLEQKMILLSDNMDFENAALIRNQISDLKKTLGRNQEMPPSLNNNNLILLIKESYNSKTIDLFFIKSGMLIEEKTIGKKAPLKETMNCIHNHYFNGSAIINPNTVEEIDEVRIVNSWLNKQRGTGHFIYIDGKKENQILSSFESEFNNLAGIRESDISCEDFSQPLDEDFGFFLD